MAVVAPEVVAEDMAGVVSHREEDIAAVAFEGVGGVMRRTEDETRRTIQGSRQVNPVVMVPFGHCQG